ncbi:hypothetical protein P4C99_06290 [Pontiellaceae bacterium B1224]|nr:hypothetical protein [Pontiellaceae bacterium B1224]
MKFIQRILGAGVLLAAASSQAAVIAYDDFAVNGPLDGSNGGSGFTNAWSDTGSQYEKTDGTVSGTGNAFRSLASTLGSNGTVWVSFDMVRTSGNSYGGLSFFEANGTNAPIERLIIGDTYQQGVWGMAHAGKANTTIPIDGDMKTAVAKITLASGATSIVELWVGANATDPVECSGTADATVTAGNLANVNILRIGAGFYLDFAELVIGQTAADVGAIVSEDTTFTAYTTGSWTNAANWSDGIPNAFDNASVDIGADVTLDTAASVQTLGIKNLATLTIADGGDLTASSNVTFGTGTTLTIGIGSGTSSGQLAAGGTLNLAGTSLVIDGTIDGDGRTFAVATGGIVGEFSNYPEESYIQSGSGDFNYFIHYVTNQTPNYITINTNGPYVPPAPDFPPRSTDELIVEGYDQRYNAYDFADGVWTDSVSVAQNATAVNPFDFSVTNTPNGRPCVVNLGSNGDGTAMNFTRTSPVATNGFTIQAVIRIDEDLAQDSRRGPYACDEATGWSGLYMGAQVAGTSQIRAGNLGNSGSGTYVLAGSANNTLDAGTWGIYTLVVNPASGDNQMVATFDLLEDGSTAFTITGDVPSTTNWVGGISASGRLFGGDMGGGADAATDNWMGAIADLVVYNRPLDSTELETNEDAFLSLYQDGIVYPSAISNFAIEPAASSTDMVVSWSTVYGGNYTLKATDNLTAPSWTEVATGIVGTGAGVSVTNSTSGSRKFYQAFGYEVIWGE